jgi:hypothetical protein
VSQVWIVGATLIVSDFAGIIIPIARWSDPMSIVYQFSSCLKSAPSMRVRSSTEVVIFNLRVKSILPRGVQRASRILALVPGIKVTY